MKFKDTHESGEGQVESYDPYQRLHKGQRGKRKGQGYNSDNSFLFISFTQDHNSIEEVNLNYVPTQWNPK